MVQWKSRKDQNINNFRSLFNKLDASKHTYPKSRYRMVLNCLSLCGCHVYVVSRSKLGKGDGWGGRVGVQWGSDCVYKIHIGLKILQIVTTKPSYYLIKCNIIVDTKCWLETKSKLAASRIIFPFSLCCFVP